MIQIINVLSPGYYNMAVKTGLLRAVGLLSFCGVLLLFQAPLNACGVCHSRNPRMVAMHARPENKACFSCHGAGLKKSPEERKAQRLTDRRCTGCHAGQQ